MTGSAHVIIGTAGHIDHGKTALIRALTGIETDTLPEEQARGVTIDVGFAYWKDDVTIIDVPGHERFVKNAVTGACSVDLALFVVAADDGVMPQTREHLAILDLLGVQRGVVALNKIDLVEPEWVELVTDDLRELFAGTFLQSAEIVPVSATTGAGVDRLRAVLEDLTALTEARPDRGALRLPIDRVFSAAGFGTVVTGTVLSGRVQPRDELVLQPQGRPVRVRGVQIHGHDRTAAGVGARAAINLADVDLANVGRGDTLAEPGYFAATYMVDARLDMLPDATVAVQNRDRVRLHLGPREVLARVILLEDDTLPPGASGYVQFRLESPGVAAHGDRFVLRRHSPAQTLGGGILLDPQPSKHRRRRPEVIDGLRQLDTDAPAQALEALLLAAAAEGRSARDLASVLGAGITDVDAHLGAMVEAGRCVTLTHRGVAWYVHAAQWQSLSQEVLAAVVDFHQANPLKAGIGRAELALQIEGRHSEAVFEAVVDRLTTAGELRAGGGRLSLAEHRVELTPVQATLRQAIRERVLAGRAAPPDQAQLADQLQQQPSEVDAVVAVMQGEGELVRLADDLLFDPEVLRQIEADLVRYLQTHGQIEVSAFRELVSTTRKYALPLLNHFDSLGLTRRDGSVRRLVLDAVDTPGTAAGD